MRWVRGKKGKMEYASPHTKVLYVFKDGRVRVELAKGNWTELGLCNDTEEATNYVVDFEMELAEKRCQQAREKVAALTLVQERFLLRSRFEQAMGLKPLSDVYKAYFDCRKEGTAHELLIELTGLAGSDLVVMGEAFLDFYKAGFTAKEN